LNAIKAEKPGLQKHDFHVKEFRAARIALRSAAGPCPISSSREEKLS
jgi:hypothetical protein